MNATSDGTTSRLPSSTDTVGGDREGVGDDIDPQLLRRFFQHWEVAVRVANGVLRDLDEAQDIATKAVVYVAGWAAGRVVGDDRAVVVTKARQLALTEAKRRSRQVPSDPADLPDVPSARQAEADDRLDLSDCLAQLLPREQAIVLWRLAGWAWADIASELDLNTGSTRRIGAQAYAKLRVCLAGETTT